LIFPLNIPKSSIVSKSVSVIVKLRIPVPFAVVSFIDIVIDVALTKT
jgi:hypothetical protein